jgi:small subunit ribosomal protein S19
MSRSKWKEPFVNEKIINQSLKKKELNKDKMIKITSKNSVIINNFVGLTFNIYTGKTFFKIEITKEMVGYKFGEFIFTRIHSPPKKKKIKRKIAFKKKST